MAKIRLTKNELKIQKESLKRYTRYLPTLELKKTQLINEIKNINQKINILRSEIEKLEKDISTWVDVFAENIDLTTFYKVEDIKTSIGNIAGIDIEMFEDVIFQDIPFSLFDTPLWVDRGVETVKKQIENRSKIIIFKKQIELLKEELRITVQRINLFDKVKIPEAKKNIKMIRIYLGDVQTAEVVRGKISKKKIQKKGELAKA